MKTQRFVAIYTIAALVALLLLLIAPSVLEATTIGTNISTGGNISTDGTLTVGGSITLNGAAASTYSIGGSVTSGTITLGGAAQTGTITVGQSTASNTINIGNGVTAAGSTQTINVGGAGAANSATTIGIGNGSGTSTITIGATSATSEVTLQGGMAHLNIIPSTKNIAVTGSTSVSGVAVFAAGSVSAPSITLTGDTDTGLAAGAVTNNLQFIAGGYAPISIGSSSDTLSTVALAGTTTISGNLRAGNGLVGNPAFSFDADPDTGIFRSAANTLQLVAGGNAPLAIGSSTSTLTGVTITGSTSVSGTILIADGTVSAPSIAFSDDTNTGILGATAADILKLVAGGYAPFQIGTSSDILNAVQINGSSTTTGNAQFGDGLVGAPSMTFAADTDTGIFRSTINTMQLVAGGLNQITVGTGSAAVVTLGTTTLSSLGSVTTPALAFSGDTNTGLFSSTTDTLDLVVGGGSIITAGSTTTGSAPLVTIAGSTTISGAESKLTIPQGSLTIPSLNFSSDTNTGIYSVADTSVKIGINGTERFSVNGANTLTITTTGSSSTTGNFSAGTSGANGSTTLDIAGSTTNSGVCHGGANTAVDDVAIVDCDATPAADYAERYPVAKDVEYGDVVVPGTRVVYTDPVQLPNADGSGFNTLESHAIAELVKSSAAYQEPIAGIVSDNWGDFSSAGNNINKKDNPKPVALVGRVPVKVTDEGGQISIGDFVTTSSTPGHAMKATKAGRVIGMALSSFSGKKGKVMVQVLNTWWTPIVGEDQTSAASSQLQAAANVSLEKVEKLVVQKNAVIQGRLIVKGNARFDGQIIVGKDTAGAVIVKAGAKTARVEFSTAYKKPPVITVTPLGNPGAYFWVSDVNEKGFTVNVSKTPSQDLSFNWIALGSNANLGEEEAKAKVETAALGTAQ
ncbi:hypothetical protein HYW83_01380 [Candidatus Peregrinibacteria bacterium]|nr:hypothetical protein [Candidatus Peregrinibacteria bacterium]